MKNCKSVLTFHSNLKFDISVTSFSPDFLTF